MLNTPATKEALLRNGADPSPNSPEEFAAFISAEIRKWALVAKAAGVKPE
jgi:tripartite-type tricarboxylate transporter receptor subunit TctC